MLVYRVEHQDTNKGPYSSDVIPVNAGFNYSGDDLHPGFYEDTNIQSYFSGLRSRGISYESRDWFFGFLNLYQMREWFNPECLKFLKEKHFILREYRVHSRFVVKSIYQCMFKFQESEIIKTKDLTF